MTKIGAVLVMGLTVCTPTFANAQQRITNDTGGVVQYRLKEGQSAKIVDGWCASACLLTLGPGTCATSRGVLAWHPAVDAQLGLPSVTWTDRILQMYVPLLRGWIESHGGMYPGGKVAAVKIFPRCKP
jgi:hypothetical protein